MIGQPYSGTHVAVLRGMRVVFPAVVATFLLLSPHGASAVVSPSAPDVWSLLAEMRKDSRNDALTIKEVYAPLVARSSFEDREHLQRALDTGELVWIDAPERFNLMLRLTGPSAIGERDLENQPLYLAARPPAMGMLFDIARRVKSGPLEVTSLVRTAEYQRALMRGNGNANTDVPTHVMGYAVDIGLKYMPIGTANELRSVLEQMREAGDIYFIGERNQLTFHVVPVPSRIDHFTRVYEEAMLAGAAAAADAAGIPAPPPPPAPSRFDRIWSWLAGLVS